MMSRLACHLVAFAFLVGASLSPALAVTLPGQPESGGGGEGMTRHVLALTWQPGFCLTRPALAECAAEGRGAAAGGLTLHGLWQVGKSYCGIDAELKRRDRSGRWSDLPELVLAEGTAKRLSVAMPGTASGLDRHQWLMNGTCHAATADDYYGRSLDLLDAVNGSAVGAFFAAHAGETVTMADVAAAFDSAFGKGAGERIRLRCRPVDGQAVVTGLTIGLAAAEGDLRTLIQGASVTKSECDAGLLALAASE